MFDNECNTTSTLIDSIENNYGVEIALNFVWSFHYVNKLGLIIYRLFRISVNLLYDFVYFHYLYRI